MYKLKLEIYAATAMLSTSHRTACHLEYAVLDQYNLSQRLSLYEENKREWSFNGLIAISKLEFNLYADLTHNHRFRRY